MKIEFIAFDSFGVKSMCTRVETEDFSIVLDPGVAIETNSFPLPLWKRIYLVEKYKRKIKKACKNSDIIIITHYHYDHHIPEKSDMYKDKILLIKDPKNYINRSQRGRSQEFLKIIKGLPKEIKIADNQKFIFDKIKIRFTKPLWHGLKGTKLGYVISCIIEDEKEKLFFSSDLDGPYLESYADMIIRENPDTLILDGPPTYLLGYLVSYKNFARCTLNIYKLVEKLNSKIVLDHHLLRDYRYKDLLKCVYDLAEKKGKQVKTAAEFLGKKPKVLECYEKYGPTKWKEWEKLSKEKIESFL